MPKFQSCRQFTKTKEPEGAVGRLLPAKPALLTWRPFHCPLRFAPVGGKESGWAGRWAVATAELGNCPAWHLRLRSNADHTIVCKGRGACRGASGIRGSHIVCVWEGVCVWVCVLISCGTLFRDTPEGPWMTLRLKIQTTSKRILLISTSSFLN